MLELTAAQLKTDLSAFLKRVPEKTAGMIQENLKEVTADGIRVSSLVMDDHVLFQELMQFAPQVALGVAQQDAAARDTKPTDDTILNMKSVFLLPYESNTRYRITDCFTKTANNPAFSPEAFTLDRNFMSAFAGTMKTKISTPLETMIYATIKRAEREEDDGQIALLGEAVHAALRSAFYNMAQTTSAGMAEALLRITHNFPDPALRRAVVSDPAITANMLHGTDQIEVTTSMAFKMITENAETLTPEVLASLHKALPSGSSFPDYEQAGYLLSLKEATQTLPKVRKLVMEMLSGFGAEALIRAAFEGGSQKSRFSRKLEEAFRGKAKSEQLQALFAVAYGPDVPLKSIAAYGKFLEFIGMTAQNPGSFRAGLPYHLIEQNLESIAANLLYRDPPAYGTIANTALEVAADLLFKNVDGAEFARRLKALRSHRAQFSVREGWRMSKVILANRHAVSSFGREIGTAAAARRTAQKALQFGGRLLGYEKV